MFRSRYGCGYHRDSQLGSEKWSAHCQCLPPGQAAAHTAQWLGDFFRECRLQNILWRPGSLD
jgi:hypothetical protein